MKSEEDLPLDIRPIAVGEALCHLVGKCVCAVEKSKASDFFAPYQFGVACAAGAEKVIHGLRSCMDDHWTDENFTVLKIDMRNAYNLVSRQALSAAFNSQSCSHGHHGAMANTQHCSMYWVL